MNVIFDVFGVLMSSGFSSSADDLVRVLGRSKEEIEQVYVKWEEPFDLGEIGQEQFWTHVLSDLDVSCSWRALNQLVLSNYRPNERALALLRSSSQFQPTHILSNTRRDWFDVLDAAYGITRHADRTFLSCDIGLKKPDVRVYQHVVRALDCPPEHVIMIDDRQENIEAARSVGLNGIVFHTADETAGALRDLGVGLLSPPAPKRTKERHPAKQAS